MKMIIAGSRTFNDYQFLDKRVTDYLNTFQTVLSFIDHYLPEPSNIWHNLEIVSGGAPGADTLAERFAEEKNLPLKVFPADWKKYNKRAGHIRNVQMGNYADMLIAFWDGKSTGTADMIDIMRKSGKICEVIRF